MTAEETPQPPPKQNPRPRRPKRPKRRGAKMLFFLVFLGLFGLLDVLILHYEFSARQEYDKSQDHLANRNPQQAHRTWARVAQQFPYSYVVCRARQRISKLPPEEIAAMPRGPENVAQMAFRLTARKAIAPALRRLAATGKLAPDRLTEAAGTIETAHFDPLTTAYVPIFASTLAFLLALYLLLSFWRAFKIRLRWRLLSTLVSGVFMLQANLRSVGLDPQLLHRLTSQKYYLDAEFLLGLGLLLALFCLLFSGKPKKESTRQKT